MVINSQDPIYILSYQHDDEQKQVKWSISYNSFNLYTNLTAKINFISFQMITEHVRFRNMLVKGCQINYRCFLQPSREDNESHSEPAPPGFSTCLECLVASLGQQRRLFLFFHWWCHSSCLKICLCSLLSLLTSINTWQREHLRCS